MQRLNAVVTYLLKDNQVLMVYGHKSYAPHFGKWNGAGGKTQDTEDAVTGAIRETQEETGYTPTNLELKAKILFTGKGAEFLVSYFVSREFTGELQAEDQPGAKAEWCEIKDGLPVLEILDGDKEFFNRIITGEYFEGCAEYNGERWVGFTEGQISPENKESNSQEINPGLNRK